MHFYKFIHEESEYASHINKYYRVSKLLSLIIITVFSNIRNFVHIFQNKIYYLKMLKLFQFFENNFKNMLK